MSSGSGLLVHTMWDVTVVTFQDPRVLEAAQIEKIGEELYRFVDEMDRKKMILDFTKVQFLASAAVGLLINLHKKSSAIKGTFIICGMRNELKKVFEIMKLTKMFKFAANEEEAFSMLGYTAGG